MFVYIKHIVYIYTQITITKKNIMTTFNNTLTIEEATKLFKFKGQTMFPKTKHNLEVMAKVIDNHLKTLRK